MPTPDTSLYPQARKPINPLEMATQAAGLVGQMNQNKLFTTKFNAANVVGDQARGAVGPDGQVDVNKFMTGVAADPAANLLMPEVAQKAQELRMAQVQTDREKIAKAVDANQAANNYMGRIMANPSKKYATQVLADGISEGNISPQKAADLYSELHGVEDTPEAIQKWLLPHQLANQEVGARLQTVYGQYQEVPTGSTIKQQAVSPVMGTTRDIGEVKLGLTPGEKTQPTIINWKDPVTGKMQQRAVTREQFLQLTGAGTGGTAPGAPAKAARPAAATPVSADGGPGVAVEAPLGAAEAASQAGAGSGKAWNELKESTKDSGLQVSQLHSALEDLSKTHIGPGTEWRQRVQSSLIALPGLRDLNLSGAKDDAEAYDELRKKLTAYTTRQVASLGSGTNDKLEAAFMSNPSVENSQQAAEHLIHQAIGIERYRMAQVQAFQESKLGPEDFSDWANKWNQSVDPRAFMADMMPNKKVVEMRKRMTGPEKEAFMKTYNTYVRAK